MRTRFCLPTVYLSFCLSLSALAQTAPPAQTPVSSQASASAPSPQAASENHRIWLDVVVTNKGHNAIAGLQEQDFTLLDDGQPRKITSFRATDAVSRATDPVLQVIFLIDAVNTGVQAVGFGKTQLAKFLRQEDGRLSAPTSLVMFTDKSAQFLSPPTRDGKALADSLDSSQSSLRALGRSAGVYGAEEQRMLSLQALDGLAHYEAKQPGRKLVIWMSPGWATLSGPRVMVSEKNEQWLFRSIVALSQELRESRITLYSIDPLGMNDAGQFRTFYYEAFLKGVPSYQKAQNGNLALQVLAAQSGGRVLNISNDIVKQITSCLEDAPAFYTLSFDSPPADHPDEYHDLEVKIGKPGLKSRTRTGYYAQPYATGQR